jgi:DNA-directed RNA polymerase subunit RPC12/RpoP
MGTKATVFMIFGIIFVILGAIFLVMFAIGTDNSKFEDDKTVGPGQSWTIGGKMASKIVGEYSSTEPINIYVGTSQFSLDFDVIEVGGTGGKIDYETPDSGQDYYLHFVNMGVSNAQVHVNLEFQSSIGLICLIPGIIMLVLGLVFLFIGFRLRKQPDRLPPQYPQQPMYQQPQQYQQPAQYPPQYQQQQYQPPPQPTPPPSQGVKTYNCPHCGKPFTSQIPQQTMVVTCPSCGGRTTIGP